MVDIFTVTPVLDAAAVLSRFEHYFFPWFAECQNQKYFVTGGYIQGLAQPFSLHRANYTAAQPLLRRTKKNALSRYSTVIVERPAYLCVAKYDDICRRPFTFTRTNPVFEVAGPDKMWKY